MTIAGAIILGLMAVLVVAGLVVWTYQASRRRHSLPGRSASSDAPVSAESAAAQHTRQADRGGLF